MKEVVRYSEAYKRGMVGKIERGEYRSIAEAKRKKVVRENGDGAVIHGNSGRHPANSTNATVKENIIALKRSEKYQKANFTHFRELLGEHEGIAEAAATK